MVVHFPQSRQFSDSCVVDNQTVCSCRRRPARWGPDGNMLYVCKPCSDENFDKIEHNNKIDLMPIRFEKLEEHTNHIDSKVNALEIEINQIASATKKYSETSSQDIKQLNLRVDMISETLKNTNARLDEIHLVFTNMKQMFIRYNGIIDLVEKHLGVNQIREIENV